MEPGSPEYEEARELRYETLYAHLGLPRGLVDDEPGAQFTHIVAVNEDRIVGYARLDLAEGACQAYQVCVLPEFRGAGVGSALMRELARLAADEGREEMSLFARTHVVGFYERLGFEAEGAEFMSPRTGTPHRVMRCRLPLDVDRDG